MGNFTIHLVNFDYSIIAGYGFRLWFDKYGTGSPIFNRSKKI
jgi:hypothetical protein